MSVKAGVTKKVPDMVPPQTIAKTSKAFGGLIFNPEVADNPDQTTFHDEAEDRNERSN